MSDSLWSHGRQASLSFTISQSLLKLMSIESVMPSNHLLLCQALLHLPESFQVSRSLPMSQLFASKQTFHICIQMNFLKLTVLFTCNLIHLKDIIIVVHLFWVPRMCQALCWIFLVDHLILLWQTSPWSSYYYYSKCTSSKNETIEVSKTYISYLTSHIWWVINPKQSHFRAHALRPYSPSPTPTTK